MIKKHEITLNKKEEKWQVDSSYVSRKNYKKIHSPFSWD